MASLRVYIQEVEKARTELNKVRQEQLHSQKRRDELRLLVEKYFNEIRPSLFGRQEQNDLIKQVDDNMQRLLVLCHKHGSVKTYQSILKDLKRDLIAVDSRHIMADTIVAKQELSIVDNQIISTLNAMVPAAALSYQQAAIDLKVESKFSWRGPATDLREALRETLDYLAPDNDVKAMSGYKQSEDTDGPTMKQKVRYVLKNRGVPKALAAPAESAVDTVEEAIGTFIRSVYTRSSVSTHTPTDKSEVLRIRDLVRVVLRELLEIRD